MAREQVYGFERDTAARLKAMVDPSSPESTRPVYAPMASIDVYWVAVDSLTLDDGRFPGHRCQYDAIADSFSDVEDIWVVAGSGGTPQLGQLYQATRHGLANDRSVWQIDSDKGVTSINGLPGPAITHAVGTGGLDHNISQSGSTVTHNIPDAGASSRGVVSTGTQTIAGAKTFTANPFVSTSTIPFLSFIESSFTVGLFGKIGTSEVGIAAYADDGFGNSTKGEIFFYLGTYDPGIPGWFDHTRLVLRSATTSPANVDDMPSYAIKAGVLNYIGVWDTVAGMDVSGGLITGGSLSVPGSAVTGALSATVVADAGTW